MPSSKARLVANLASGSTFANAIIDNVNANTFAARFPSLAGDVQNTEGSNTVTLRTTGVTAGSYGNTTAIPVITVDAKGRITSATTNSVSGVTGVSWTAANSTVTVSTSTVAFSANIQAANSTVQGLTTVLDSVTNTSVSIAASANSAKNAYDRAIDANTRAYSAQTAATSAYTNAVAYAAANTYVNTQLDLKANLSGATFSGDVSGITTLAAGNTTITGFANVTSSVQVGSNTIFFANGDVNIGSSGGSVKKLNVHKNDYTQIRVSSGLAPSGSAGFSLSVPMAGTTTNERARIAYVDNGGGTTWNGSLKFYVGGNTSTLAEYVSIDQSGNTTITGATTFSNTIAVTGTSTFTGLITGTITSANNADYLDGQHGAYYAANSQLASYALKAGPTFTGTAAFADVTISGNLTTSGTTTYVNTTNLNVGDNIITLNADVGAVAPTENAGIEVNRGTSANVALRWNETLDKWETTVDGTTYLTVATNTDVSTAYSNAITYSGNAALAYTNAVAYAAANTYVNTQLGLKANLSGATFSGAVSGITTLAAGNTTITGFANVSGAGIFGTTVTANGYNVGNSTVYSTATMDAGNNLALNGWNAVVFNVAGVNKAGIYPANTTFSTNTYINSSLAVTGGSTLTGAVTMANTLAVTGTSTFTGLITGTVTSANNASYLGGQAYSNVLMLLSTGTEANIDTYTDNGIRSINYAGHSRHLLSWNAAGSTGTIQQEFHYNTPANGWRIRNKTDNTSWSSWGYVTLTTANQGHIGGTIWHSANDGTGSGLDADLLEGQHGSYYAANSQLASYALLSGATFTGTITSTASYPQIKASPASSHSYISSNRANTTTGEVGYLWQTAGVSKWWNYMATNDSGEGLRWYNSAGDKMTLSTAGSLTVAADVRAPLFYDSDNTGYYVNPASTSALSKVSLASGTLVGGVVLAVGSNANDNLRFGTRGTLLSDDTHITHNMYYNGGWYQYDSTKTSSGIRVGTINNNSIVFQQAAAGASAWTDRALFDTSGHFLPGADATYDLGSTSYRWNNIYTADAHFSNEGTEGNSVDGTTGNWTLQEGEEFIYMLNNKTGKRYKIKMEEV